MRRHLLWLVPLSILIGLADAQTPVPIPTTTYKLNAQKEHRSANLPSTFLYLLPDQALLVLVPQLDGKWVLKRLSAWETSNPKEETIALTGQHPQKGAVGSVDLKVDPAGVYAIVRFKSSTGSTYPMGQRSALVVLVDVRSFTIVSQRTTTDPLFAESSWSFTKEGLLIARAQTERLTVPPGLKGLKEYKEYQSITDTYHAAAFTLPDWKTSMTCQYERLLDQSPWHLSKVGDGCAALVEVAHVATAENLPGGDFPSDRYANLLKPCQLTGESPSANFALYSCRTGNDYLDAMIQTTKTRNLKVLSIPDGKTVLTVPLPHNMTPIPALLANARRHTWLLILSDGIKLETYQLP
jgi:hypothetical protein